jgi:hypothetical protein
MIEYDSLFKTFKGLKKRENPHFPGYIYDILGRLAGIVLLMFVILLVISFLSFALKPFNITITRVVELFWRDYTFLILIPLSIPSMFGTIKEMFIVKEKTFVCVSSIYLFILIAINVVIVIFGTIPILRLLGA